ncbi:MAG: hypothetical protein AAGL98_09875 [Planctomycetota bacterium]
MLPTAGAVLILISDYLAGLATPEWLRELDSGSPQWARVGPFEGLVWRNVSRQSPAKRQIAMR